MIDLMLPRYFPMILNYYGAVRHQRSDVFARRLRYEAGMLPSLSGGDAASTCSFRDVLRRMPGCAGQHEKSGHCAGFAVSFPEKKTAGAIVGPIPVGYRVTISPGNH